MRRGSFALAGLILLALLSARASAAKIQWYHNAEKAAEAMQATGKPLLLFVGSEHCQFCRKMKRTTWANKAIADYVNRGFIPLMIDADEAPELVKHLEIKALPTTIAVSPEGKVLDRVKGYMPPRKFGQHLTATIRAQQSVASRPNSSRSSRR